MEYIVYLDESVSKGEYCSDFFGGVLVSAHDFDEVNSSIALAKERNNLFQEVKWTKVTENYLEKYKAIIDVFFHYVKTGQLKMRVMFRQNAKIPNNLTQVQIHNKYHLLYYQFVKHAFGFQFCNPELEHDVFLHLYFDKIPDTATQNEEFKSHILGLQYLKGFQASRIKIRKDDIVEIDSKKHPILQCMDIVLGAMAFKLNQLDRIKDPITNKRGKKTIAKENLYKHILKNIQALGRPHFNIGVSTSNLDKKSRWSDPYRHWLFEPRSFREDRSMYKKK